MPSVTCVTLDVPFADKDRVKALGARWDHHARRWYVPAGVDLAAFAAWMEPSPAELPSGPTVTARVVLFPETCYRCGAATTCVAGVVIDPGLGGDPGGFIPFSEIGGYLVQLLPRELFARFGVGRVGFRRSSVRPEGYIANGCRVCDTILGEFYLEEALLEYLAEGGDYARLAVAGVELPIACIPEDDCLDDEEITSGASW